MIIDTLEALEAIYETPPLPAATVKDIGQLTPDYRRLIEASPFVALATVGPEGLDCSPRGDGAGFVRILDDRTLVLPDRRGNNRIDSLRNIVRDPRVALIFLVPGVGETLRVNGRARISVEPALLESFIVDGKAPRSVLLVTIETVYFQCTKALVRSHLWDAARHVERKRLPSTGAILAAISKGGFDGEAYDKAYPERLKQTLY